MNIDDSGSEGAEDSSGRSFTKVRIFLSAVSVIESMT